MRVCDLDEFCAHLDAMGTINALGLEPLMAVKDVKEMARRCGKDAIPVEWLWKTSERVLSTTGQKLVDALIERWQKEQEAR